MRRFALILAASTACLAAAPASGKSGVYLSLMGEPFRTNEAGEDPFDQWLKLADQNGDAGVSRLELRADAESFFAALDGNDDKVIDADEMGAYEDLAPGRTRAAGGGAEKLSSRRPTPKASADVPDGHAAVVTSNAPSSTRIHPGKTRINYAEVPQPVAMADLNLDRRVTLEEFLKTAGKRFVKHDVNQDGRLTREELR